MEVAETAYQLSRMREGSLRVWKGKPGVMGNVQAMHTVSVVNIYIILSAPY